MKNIIYFLVVMISVSGCDWVQKNKIEKVISDFYTIPLCLDWDDIKKDDQIINVLAKANVLIKKQIRKQAGIMGYKLEFNYDVKDQTALCYGQQFVQEIKAIDFADTGSTTVSFVVDTVINQDWAQADIFQKYRAQGKQLRRAHLIKKEGDWIIIPAQHSK